MTTFEYLPDADGDLMVALLGGSGLFWGSTPLRVPRASQRLVAFLALHRGMVRRTAVAGSLWPDASERHACANLRQALARLQPTARKALAASKLELGLADDVTVDVRHARALARRLLDPAVTPEQPDLGTAAVGVLSAELLPDWDDDWVLLEAEDWRQLRLHALEALAGRLAADGRCGEAAGAAGAAVRQTHSEKAPEPASSRCIWLRATSRRRSASSPATSRCFMSTLALSPPPAPSPDRRSIQPLTLRIFLPLAPGPASPSAARLEVERSLPVAHGNAALETIQSIAIEESRPNSSGANDSDNP